MEENQEVLAYRLKLMGPLVGMSPSGQIISFPRAHNVLVAPVPTACSDISKEDKEEVMKVVDDLCEMEANFHKGGE